MTAKYEPPCQPSTQTNITQVAVMRKSSSCYNGDGQSLAKSSLSSMAIVVVQLLNLIDHYANVTDANIGAPALHLQKVLCNAI